MSKLSDFIISYYATSHLLLLNATAQQKITHTARKPYGKRNMSNGIEENGEENINFEHVNVLCFLFTDYDFTLGHPIDTIDTFLPTIS